MERARDSKVCIVCGRRFEYRATWARDWDQVTHCSKSCRKRGRRPIDDELETAILSLLRERASGATICPSEAARAVDKDEWKPLMEDARMAARRLVDAGRVEIMQKRRVVDPSKARGPIRIRLR